MIDEIICGDALQVLQGMETETVDCCISSPPYWSLRDYQTDGQLGLEPTPDAYTNNLLTVFDEVKRVLKGTGTCWVVIGDSYSSGNRKTYDIKHGFVDHTHVNAQVAPNRNNCGIPDKSLCNIPFRFAIGMVDRGWVQRNTIIWAKPSCMPSSAKDRFTVDFEYVFFFAKNGKYYFEQQFEAYTEPLNRWGGNQIKKPQDTKYVKPEYHNDHTMRLKGGQDRPNPAGRNKRTVWTVEKDYTGQAVKDYESAKAQNASDVKRRTLAYMKAHPDGSANKRTVWRVNPASYKGAHFAVFPEQLVQPMVLAGCPPGGLVIDPFVGSGTTAVVAHKLGRCYIGIDLNPDYVKMSQKRLTEVL